MSLKEVTLAIEGLREQNDITEDIYRRMTFIIALSGMNGDAVRKKFNTLWPKTGAVTTAQSGKDLIRRVREREAKRNAHQKLNAGRS